MAMQIIQIESEYITLGQLLKNEAIIVTGGQAKWFLSEHEVLVNEQVETRRGRKLYPNDQINIPAIAFDVQIQAKCELNH